MNILQKLFGNPGKIRKQEIELISMLNRWYQVKEDLMYAFEKIIDSDIGEPTKTIVLEFVTRVKGGLSQEIAMDMMADSFKDESFQYYLKQIAFNLRYRGNMGELLDNMETQILKVEEEYTRRKIGTAREKNIIKILYFVSPVLMYLSVKSGTQTQSFYLNTGVGKIVFFICLVIYAISLLIFYISGRKYNGN